VAPVKVGTVKEIVLPDTVGVVTVAAVGGAVYVKLSVPDVEVAGVEFPAFDAVTTK
jgi:hypothetical protein